MKQNSLSKIKKVVTVTPVGLIDPDEDKKKNFQLIGKMFGNLTESIKMNGQNTLKSNVSSKFSGGFKPAAILKNNKPIGDQKVKKQSKLDVFTVYDEFGLINESIGKKSLPKDKPKYRQDDPQGQYKTSGLIKESSLIDDMRNNRRQQFEQVMQNNYVNLHEYYDLAKEKSREQTVIHVKSSLDSMTLENVEAKLQAHRREMRPIEESYKAKKGIKQEEIQSDNNESSPNKYFTKTVENDPYKQYGKTQSQIYEMIKKKQKDDPQEIVLDQMWQEKLRQNPKIAQYTKKYQQYLVQKDAKNIMFSAVRQNIFNWDKYTQPAPDTSTKSIKKPKSHEKSISKLNKSLQKFVQQSEQDKTEFEKKNINEVLASKDDKFIAKYIFAQVDVDKKGLLSKEELLDYITKSQHIIKSYRIDMKWIYTDLDNFQTKRKGMLNKDELALFLATFQHIFHPQIKLTNASEVPSQKQAQSLKKQTKNSPFEIYFTSNLYRFRNLFQKLDINEDKILKRQEFVENIFIDPDCSQIIDKVVIKIKIIEKDITYRQIISFVLNDYRNERNQKLKKSKEYITFNRFCEYFECPQSINLKQLQKRKGSKSSPITNEIEIFDLEDENLMILKDIFDTIPRVYQDFIVIGDFVQTALKDPLVLGFQEDMCRIQSIETGLPIETVRLTLQRMVRQADQYIDWDSAKFFFSRRGRPLDWNQELINKKKAVRQEQRNKSINETLKRELIMKNEFEISAKLKDNYLNRQKKRSQNNFTIPQPFKITDQVSSKDRVKVYQKDESQFKELASTFKANPVNKEILESKPQLIQGRRPASSNKSKPEYKYENYENDRIQRVLKKAQQQHQLQEKLRNIKQKSNIKANQIGVDLTKKFVQIMKDNNRKKKQDPKKSKKPLTEIQKKIAQRLHPSAGYIDQKLKKIAQKTKAAQQAEKAKEIQKKQQMIRAQQLIISYQQKVKNIKRAKQEEEKKRKQAAASSEETFKPNLNPIKPLTEEQEKAIAQAQRKRQFEEQQRRRKILEQNERRIKAILQRQLKDPYLKLSQLQNSDEIINKIYQINILDLLIDAKQKNEFIKDHDFGNKNKKQREVYLKGMANKFKITMEKQERVMKAIKIREKEDIQKGLVAPKQTSILSEKGKSKKMQNDLCFHGSKALRRYRLLMDEKTSSQIPSQFDRYTEFEFDNKNKPQKLPDVQEDQQN